MHVRRHLSIAATALVAISWAAAPVAGQATNPAPSGAEAGTWTPPRTPWGDPDIQGTYTNKDENGTPLERPAEFAGKRLEDFGPAEMAQLRAERQARAAARAPGIGGEETGAGPPHWYEHLDAENAKPWLITEPADGQIPPLTPEAKARIAAQGERRRDDPRGFEDLSLYDRCISRGVPGSMMPAIYGSSYDIVQSPDHVVIRYEMIHEARVIPLDRGPRLAEDIRQYMGDARGHWEGDTLVVRTTNFRDETAYRNATERLVLTERFTPVGPDTLRWEVRLEDPSTWERPWAFAMPLKRDPESQVFEYACHEGNRGLENILRAIAAQDGSSGSR